MKLQVWYKYSVWKLSRMVLCCIMTKCLMLLHEFPYVWNVTWRLAMFVSSADGKRSKTSGRGQSQTDRTLHRHATSTFVKGNDVIDDRGMMVFMMIIIIIIIIVNLQHVCWSGLGAIVCKSHVTSGALNTCNMSCYVPHGTKGQFRY